MRLTIVPNRNAIMLMIAMGIAGARKRARVAYAAHAGDHAIYPDCRPEFVRAAREMGEFVGWGEPIRLYAPYTDAFMTKADIVVEGQHLNVFSRFGTWSCYKGGVAHCGKCGTCVERREAFTKAGVLDRTRYLSDEEPFASQYLQPPAPRAMRRDAGESE
jgi:7-cyano-7-deazaguanine synthase